jgi:hypothetical protein
MATRSSGSRSVRFSVEPGEYAVCRLEARDAIPPWAMGEPLVSITRTEEELSIVCPVERIPSGVESDTGWVRLRLHGPFPLDAVGVLRSVLDPLADARISVFAISTFATDHVLVKRSHLTRAADALRAAGHSDTP